MTPSNFARLSEYVPRGPMYEDTNAAERIGTYDPDGYAPKLESWRQAAKEESLRMYRLNPEAEKVAGYLKQIQGEQWDARRPRWRSRFVDNRIQKSRYDDLALLSDARPVINVKTGSAGQEKVAQLINLAIRHEWLNRDMDFSLMMAADICKAYGTAFWKIGAAKPGMLKVTPCGPDQCFPIQPGFDIQSSTAVRYRTWKSIAFLKRRFPMCATDIEREADTSPTLGLSDGSPAYYRPANIDQYTWERLNPGMQRVLGKPAPQVEPTPNFFSSVETEEYYVDDPQVNESTRTVIMRDPYLPLAAHNWWYKVGPGEPLYPRKRLLVFGGKRLLYDGPSPFWHGLYPFSVLRLNPIFASFWGLSKYRDLVPINSAINEIIAGCMDLIKRALNPTAITKEGGIPSTAWKEFFPDMPGAKLRVGMNTQLSDALRYMDPPNIPAYVIQMLQGWLGPEFDRMSGAIDVQAMNNKKQMPSGDSIDMMKSAAQTGTRLEGRMQEMFLRDSGTQAVSNVLQFFSAQQFMRIGGEQGIDMQMFNDGAKTLEDGNLLPADQEEGPNFWKLFNFEIEAGSLHGGARDRSKQLSFMLAKMGLISKQQLYRDLEFSEAKIGRIMDELKSEAQSMPQPQGKGGKTPRGTRDERQGKPPAM